MVQLDPKPQRSLQTIIKIGPGFSEGFIEIGSVVSEHGLLCSGFWGFWTNLEHLGWANKKLSITVPFQTRRVEWWMFHRNRSSSFGAWARLQHFWGVWTNLNHLGWTNTKISKIAPFYTTRRRIYKVSSKSVQYFRSMGSSATVFGGLGLIWTT